MKILIVAHDSNLSGANRSMIDLIEALIKDYDYNITVLCPGRGPLSESLINKKIQCYVATYWWNYYPISNNVFIRNSRKLKMFLGHLLADSPRKICKQFNNNDFDYVITNTCTVDIGFRISCYLNIPHIWYIREFGEEDHGITSYHTGKKRLDILNKSSGIITISNALYNKYKSMLPDKNITYVYDGFKIEKYISYNSKELNKSNINIIIVGNVAEGKGQLDGIRAVKKLIDRGYNINLFLAGGCNKAYLNRINNEFNLSLNKWIHVLGAVDNVSQLRDNMDIELICSRCEAFGRIVIEAMLHKLTVIASNSGALPELIKNNVYGYLYNPGDIDDLSSKIEFAIQNSVEANKIREQAFEYSKTFTIQNTANQVNSYLRNLCKENESLLENQEIKAK